MSTWPITYDEVLRAEAAIRPLLAPTPLRHYPELDEVLGLHVLLKHENHQPTQAFKVRNGLAVLAGLSDEEKRRGVVAASTGNYGQGLAWAGWAMKSPVVICAPHGISEDKIRAMRGWGAEVVIEGRDYDEAIRVMKRLAAERGLIEAHGVNHPGVIRGAATMTLEITRQLEARGAAADAMFIAIGGGSQAVGAMTVLRHEGRGTRVIGVQAAGAATIHEGWHARRAIPLGEPVTTFAEGIATRSCYALTFPALLEGLSEFVTVSDEEMSAAIRLLMRCTHNLVEPAGAAAMAALFRERRRFAGQTVVVIVSGSNIDNATLKRIL